MSSKDPKPIYEKLVGFESGKKEKSLYPIHKKLNLPRTADGADQQDLFDYILNNFHFKEGIRILDVGCGVGFGLIQFSQRLKCKGVGISISPKEIELARQNADQLGLEEQCEFEVKDFDSPIATKFDLILAVESIKHSANLSKTIANLTDCLNPGGKFILVEDYAHSSLKANDKDLKDYMKYWNLTNYYSKKDFEDVFHNSQNNNLEWIDLTDYVIHKNPLLLDAIHFGLKITSSIPLGKLAAISKIYYAGTALEKLYKRGLMSYQILIAEKS